MRKQFVILTALVGVLLITACTKETLIVPVELENPENLQAPFSLETEEELEAFEKELQAITSNSRNGFGRTIILKANSHNALQHAVNSVGRFGKVVLKKGHHLQEGTVTISNPVYIIGEEGAKLTTNVPAYTGTGILHSAFHILGGSRVVIWGIEMTNKIDGGTAIIIEDSKKAVIAKSNINNYQTGILIEQGDQALIWKNTVRLTPKATEFEFPFGITVVNGDKVKITANKVSNALFGIWACDRNGEARFNETYNNVIGLILCNVPISIPLESGIIGSEEPGNHWQVEHNYSHDNASTGYLVIDGANNNSLVNNKAGNNGAYDMELTTDSQRFGFFTPRSFENFVDVGFYDDITIKDCGDNNTIIGGRRIDTSVDACF